MNTVMCYGGHTNGVKDDQSQNIDDEVTDTDLGENGVGVGETLPDVDGVTQSVARRQAVRSRRTDHVVADLSHVLTYEYTTITLYTCT